MCDFIWVTANATYTPTLEPNNNVCKQRELIPSLCYVSIFEIQEPSLLFPASTPDTQLAHMGHMDSGFMTSQKPHHVSLDPITSLSPAPVPDQKLPVQHTLLVQQLLQHHCIHGAEGTAERVLKAAAAVVLDLLALTMQLQTT